MKILFSSPAFAPGIGGLETVVAILAEQLTRLGQEVVVVTETASATPDRAPYRVVRRPGPGELLRLARWCEVFLQANVSLRGLWPLLLVRRPWAVSHHSWYCRTGGRVAWQDRLKRALLRRAAVSISVSRAMAADLGTPSLVIANPYRDDLFRTKPEIQRTRELVFVGRLVSDKGVDLLLTALARLADRGLRPRLTIIGDGPERRALEEQARRLGIADRVDFAGTKTGGELVDLLNRHHILVAPSRYHEPFGVVALEAIACGCAVVGSEGGGLPEAMGPCGRTFRNGDAEELSGLLAELLGGLISSPESLAPLRRHAAGHLAGHTGERVARSYLDALQRAL